MTETFIGIENCTQLQGITAGTTATYKLLNDIDCSATLSWNNGRGFIPLQNFNGKFNGNRKSYPISL
ncbi:MAG: hypothetical protein R3A80_09425 [Bdellovibrionota bacterium]